MCQGDVGAALLRVVLGEGVEDDPGFRPGYCNDFFGKLKNCVLHRVSQVDRSDESLLVLHHPDHPLHQVGDIAEGAGLGTVAEDGDIFIFQGLEDEVGNDPAVVLGHPGTVGVEDADDADVHVVLAVIVHHQGLGHPFPLVVAAADADGVDVAPVSLALGVHLGVAVDLGGGCLQDAGLHPFGHAQHVDHAHDAGLDGLDRVVLVVHRRGGAGQVVDAINLQEDRLDDVVTDQLEAVAVHQMDDVVFAAGEEVVQTDDIVSFIQ